MKRSLVAVAVALGCLSSLAAGPAAAGPLSELPTCVVQAAVVSETHGAYWFGLSQWFEGVGYGETDCTMPAPSSAIVVEVKALPGGYGADANDCRGQSICPQTAEARTREAPDLNCTVVTAKGVAAGALVERPADTDSSCVSN